MKYRGKGVLKFDIEVYRHTVHFLYMLPRDEVERYARRNFGEPWGCRDGVDYETGHFAHDEGYSGASAIMIAQRLDPDHAFSHEVIAHEIQHVLSNVCKENGMMRTIDNDEPWAYLTGYLTRKIYEWLLAK